jgi:hypothetical protein
MLDRGQVDEFAERGFLVLPQAVPPDVVATAAEAIDELIEHDPPGADVRGPYNYFPEAAQVPALAAVLTGSPAFGLAESLTGPGTLVVPWQVQVALNIPPFPHRPGMHHIDGAPSTPPEPDGRPGTFTMLAGVLMSDQRGQDAGTRSGCDSSESGSNREYNTWLIALHSKRRSSPRSHGRAARRSLCEQFG